MPGKKQVRLAFCDLAPDWDARDNYFTQALEHAGWEITFCNGPEEKPDFVLCGTFGFDFLKYDCCRIQFSGEDSWPDLNLYDYAMGFEVLDFDGRYLRLPLYAMRNSWAPALTKHTVPDEELLAKKKFCNFVVSNDYSNERNEFFAALNAYRPVDSGGGYMNNIGGTNWRSSVGINSLLHMRTAAGRDIAPKKSWMPLPQPRCPFTGARRM